MGERDLRGIRERKEEGHKKEQGGKRKNRPGFTVMTTGGHGREERERERPGADASLSSCFSSLRRLLEDERERRREEG